MTAVDDIRARFALAQSRREELTASLEQAEETAAQRRALELELEAHELAAKMPELLAEYRRLLGEIPAAYFDFEQVAQTTLGCTARNGPKQALAHQVATLGRIYRDHGFGEHNPHNGLKQGPSGRPPGPEGVDNRYSEISIPRVTNLTHDQADELADIARKLQRGELTEFQAETARNDAQVRFSEAERERKRKALYAPSWLPRLADSRAGDRSLDKTREQLRQAWMMRC